MSVSSCAEASLSLSWVHVLGSCLEFMSWVSGTLFQWLNSDFPPSPKLLKAAATKLESQHWLELAASALLQLCLIKGEAFRQHAFSALDDDSPYTRL